MRELDEQNVGIYLRERGLVGGTKAPIVQALAWGVSNVVLRVTPAEGDPFVLKQSRAQLRTKDPWFSRLDRIWREVDVMRVLEPLLPGVVPRVLFEDRENYLFGMEAAPADHVVWKQLLLEGQADTSIASRLGTILATVHRGTALREDVQEQLRDTEVFIQLRIDPFYRRVAEACPEVRAHVETMIAEMFATPVCLVHADFSPKNVLIAGDRIVLVDYETGHYGDPAFDLGFFLSHLLLKTVLHAERFEEYAALSTAFWGTYRAGLQQIANNPPFSPEAIQHRTWPHLAGCMWARIDGTSKVDYLSRQREQDVVRSFCRSLFLDPPEDWVAGLKRLKSRLEM